MSPLTHVNLLHIEVCPRQCRPRRSRRPAPLCSFAASEARVPASLARVPASLACSEARRYFARVPTSFARVCSPPGALRRAARVDRVRAARRRHRPHGAHLFPRQRRLHIHVRARLPRLLCLNRARLHLAATSSRDGPTKGQSERLTLGSVRETYPQSHRRATHTACGLTRGGTRVCARAPAAARERVRGAPFAVGTRLQRCGRRARHGARGAAWRARRALSRAPAPPA